MFSAVELAAQATSSAAQVVTFGVRRIALQAKTTSYVANTNTQTSVKVTTGSDSQVQSAVEFRTTTAEQTYASLDLESNGGPSNLRTPSVTPESKVYNAISPLTKSLPPHKLFVTFTE
jgi:hypothetical protein